MISLMLQLAKNQIFADSTTNGARQKEILQINAAMSL
jgi:hypothetical protein